MESSHKRVSYSKHHSSRTFSVTSLHLSHQQFWKDKLYTIVTTHECSGISSYWQLLCFFNSAYRKYERKKHQNSALLLKRIIWWPMASPHIEAAMWKALIIRFNDHRFTFVSSMLHNLYYKCIIWESSTHCQPYCLFNNSNSKTWKRAIRLRTTDPLGGESTSDQRKHQTESQQCEKHSPCNFTI